MFVVLLVACGGADAPEAPAVVAKIEPDPPPSAAPAPVKRTLSLQLASGWNAGRPPCEPPCSVADVGSVRASTEKAGRKADRAIDGDLKTKWCGLRGERDQLLVKFSEAMDLSGVVLHAPGLTRVELISSDWDQAVWTLEPAPGTRTDPPWTPLGFENVRYVNLEIKGLEEDAKACIDELAFVGTPTGAD